MISTYFTNSFALLAVTDVITFAQPFQPSKIPLTVIGVTTKASTLGVVSLLRPVNFLKHHYADGDRRGRLGSTLGCGLFAPPCQLSKTSLC